jgi:chemotaxis signal transduction protein
MGVMNLRGNLLPVFNLHQLLDVGERGRNKQTVLVLDQGSDMVGVAIDGLPESVTPNRTLRSLPPLHEALQEHVSAAYTTDDTIWLDFDHQSFFTTLGRQVTS